MLSSHGFVVKAKRKHRASATGKRGEQGRFITLKTGRVIFIPATGGTKWADVREKVLASQEAAAIRKKKLNAEETATADQGRQRLDQWLGEHTGKRRGTWETSAVGMWPEASQEERAILKAQVAKELSEATGISEDKVSEFVKQWAKSSNDADMRSLAIQRDAAEEFGLELSDFTKEKIKETGERFERTRKYQRDIRGWTEERIRSDVEFFSSFRPLMDSESQRKLLRAMYDRTQADLAARGIKEVRLHRGVGFDGDPEDWYSRWRGGSVEIETNALESWSISSSVAGDFAVRRATHQAVGVWFRTTVPAERILSTPITGFGCLTEGEVLVLGGVGGDTAEIGQVFDAPYEGMSEAEIDAEMGLF